MTSQKICNICKCNYRLEKMVDRTEKFCDCDLDGSDMETIYTVWGSIQ